tara:strand:+ start:1584 stop:1889 length:306 start_codon:yes stop_codon:yes gene_type:complete
MTEEQKEENFNGFEKTPKESDQNFNARKNYPSFIWKSLKDPKCSKEKFTTLYLIDENIRSAIERMQFGLKNGCIATWQEEQKGNKGKDCSMECESFNNREN